METLSSQWSPRRVLLLAVSLFLLVGASRAEELSGKVVRVVDTTVHIALEGDLLPNPGDPVRLGFDVPGVGIVHLEGTWSVTEVTDEHVVAVLQGRASGEPARHHLATIDSARPRRRGGPDPEEHRVVPPEAVAAYEKGMALHRGSGKDGRDDEAAYRAFRKAASKDHSGAMLMLGVFHENGYGGAIDDPSIMIHHYEACWNAGDSRGALYLGRLYRYEKPGRDNEAKALLWLRRAADRGEREAHRELGFMHQNGIGVPQDYEAAVKEYRIAAGLGSLEAMNDLGFVYGKGWGVPLDPVEAVRWYRKAAEGGLAVAASNLAIQLEDGNGVEKDLAQARAWFRKAGDGGFTKGTYRLGLLLEKGRGGPVDLAGAIQCYRKAAEADYVDAQWKLGRCYDRGIEVKEDPGQAFPWYLKAATAGHATACNDVGFFYVTGRGVAQSDEKAIPWIRKAAEKGNHDGLVNLGLLHDLERGLPRDDVQSAKYYRRAADEGFAKAQHYLARAYAAGRGVPKDDAEAVRLYRLAARGGWKEAQDELRRRGLDW